MRDGSILPIGNNLASEKTCFTMARLALKSENRVIPVFAAQFLRLASDASEMCFATVARPSVCTVVEVVGATRKCVRTPDITGPGENVVG